MNALRRCLALEAGKGGIVEAKGFVNDIVEGLDLDKGVRVDFFQGIELLSDLGEVVKGGGGEEVEAADDCDGDRSTVSERQCP